MRRIALLLILAPVLLTPPSDAEAQGVNGRAISYVTYLQVQGLVLDSVPVEGVPGDGVQRKLSDGTPSNCGEVQCVYYRSGPKGSVIPLLQDVELNIWTGVTGLRAYAHVRGRSAQGDKKLWPRSQESFEALAAYVEYSRSFYRIQAGRMWQTTSLGFYNFDGGSVSLRIPKGLNVELFGGVSLVRGLNQLHHSDLISSVESLEPRFDAFLGGVHARWRPVPAVSTAFTYQREGTRRYNDLYAERVAGSARLQLGRATLNGEVKYDLATRTTNLARATLSAPLAGGLRGTVEIRRYVPFFELWTIWGAFSPVGFQEAQARLDWMSPSGRASGHVYGSKRGYDQTDADAPPGSEIRDDGWRLAAGGRLTLRDGLILGGEYRRDVGFGSSRSGGEFSLQQFLGQATYLAIQGTAFETFSEFRVGSGTVVGGGIVAETPIGPATLRGNAMLYKHTQTDRPSILDLNQTRMSLTLEIPIGRDPGLAGRGNQ